MDLSKVEELFPITKTDVYLNHAAVSSFSINVINSLNDYFERRSKGDVDTYPYLVEVRQQLKKNIGILINGQPENVAIITNTSEGLNWLANGLKWNSGDRILLTDYEFPSNVYPFLNLKRFGVEVDFVKNRYGKILLEDIDSAITPKTKLLSISFVEFLNGFRNNLYEIGKICKAKDIVFSVDGIQGIGALQFDVQKFGVDFVSNGGHKWLMGPQGCGFMYISPELHTKLTPIFAGWLSVKDSWNFLDYQLDFLDDASRYEIGTMNATGVVGLQAATDILVNVNPEQIENHLISLGKYLIDSMLDMGFSFNGTEKIEERSGITSFVYKNSHKIEGLFKLLKKNRIHISVRNGALRISPHFYNKKSDIDMLVKTCKTYLNKN
ncbi:aminotransferase class V-fold PLP-dependent enzyme [Calditrichota bacterium]